MKKLITLIFSLIVLTSFSQTDVYLKINHMLGSNSFAFNQQASNNLGNPFKVSRLEYYISEITVIHDGGQDTTIEDLWILVNANNTTNVMLGTLPITSLEGIKFGLGVDPDHNHLDPASYPMSHPLAPKSPSMHWGWSAGYRFAAFEGKTGSSLNQTTELHALGDGNYHHLTILTSGVMNGSDLNIELDADYEGLLHDIDASQGLIIHGEVNEAAELLENFVYHVFTSSEGNASINVAEESALKGSIIAFPNPSNGVFNVENTYESNVDISVLNSLGQSILEVSVEKGTTQKIDLLDNGMYVLRAYSNGVLLETTKVVVSK